MVHETLDDILRVVINGSIRADGSMVMILNYMLALTSADPDQLPLNTDGTTELFMVLGPLGAILLAPGLPAWPTTLRTQRAATSERELCEFHSSVKDLWAPGGRLVGLPPPLPVAVASPERPTTASKESKRPRDVPASPPLKNERRTTALCTMVGGLQTIGTWLPRRTPKFCKAP